MEYTGKLYGKIGRRLIPLTMTSEEVDALRDSAIKNAEMAGDLASDLQRLRSAVRNLRDVQGRHHTQIATERLFALLPENVKGVARRKVDEQSEANDGRYPPLPLPSCSFSSFGVGGYWGETLTREKRREYEDHLRGLNADQIIEEAFHEMRDAMIPKNSRAGMVLSVLTGIALRKVAR